MGERFSLAPNDLVDQQIEFSLHHSVFFVMLGYRIINHVTGYRGGAPNAKADAGHAKACFQANLVAYACRTGTRTLSDV